jgi:hypothetical protein
MIPQAEVRRRGVVLAVLVFFGLSMIVLGTDTRGEPAATPPAPVFSGPK